MALPKRYTHIHGETFLDDANELLVPGAKYTGRGKFPPKKLPWEAIAASVPGYFDTIGFPEGEITSKQFSGKVHAFLLPLIPSAGTDTRSLVAFIQKVVFLGPSVMDFFSDPQP